MTTPIELDDFEAALTDDERAAYQSFQKALNEATHAKAIAGSFIAWASPSSAASAGTTPGEYLAPSRRAMARKDQRAHPPTE